MRKSKFRLPAAFALSLIVSFAIGSRANAQSASEQSLPDYMNVIVGNGAPTTKSQVAEQNVLTLYRPGKAPLEAAQVPIRYQVYKSVGHSALAVFELAGSHLGTVSDQSWM